jgi:hypothetical protein
VFDRLEKDAKQIYKKQSLTMTDLQSIQEYIIVALLGGLFIPPRRLLDYTEFRVKNIKKTNTTTTIVGRFILIIIRPKNTMGSSQLKFQKNYKQY